MSFLTPLYALAAMAVALPILFHLIKKQPRGNQVFSSLMFLEPSPPRLTRRSNVDQWLLLILRGLALMLLAAAFARPFWNEPLATSEEQASSRRILMLDTSASMRRDGIWEKALDSAKKEIQEMGPMDTIGLYTFDTSVRPLVSLSESMELLPNQRKERCLATLKNLEPTWNHTDLGLALITASDLFNGDENTESESIASDGEIVVVTDFQMGSKLDRLENYQWPEGSKVKVVRVAPNREGNARANLQSDESLSNPAEKSPNNAKESESKDSEVVRVRVANEPNSAQEKFTLRWLDKEGSPLTGSELSIQVPAGSSMVGRMIAMPPSATQLRLEGDDASFDNEIYVANAPVRDYELLCVDVQSRPSPENLSYFIEQLPLSHRKRKVAFARREPGSDAPWSKAERSPLIITSSLVAMSDAQALQAHMQQGGHVLLVLDRALRDESAIAGCEGVLKELLGAIEVTVEEGRVRSYSMMQQIDFQNPLFRPFADSRFNDFTKVKFWAHRKLSFSEPDAWTILSRFDDDGSPAIASRRVGEGTLWLFASGWQPAESQLALSTKFVPIIAGIFDQAAPQDQRQEQWFVGERMPIVQGERILDPLGSELSPEENFQEERKEESKSAEERWVRFEKPGLYSLQIEKQGESATRSIAVNVSLSESDTAPADQEQLGRLGVRFTDQRNAVEKLASKRQLRAMELEAQQGWWRWLILGVVGAVALESLICVFRKSQVTTTNIITN